MASMVLVDSTVESLTSSVNAPLGLSVKAMILGFQNGVGVFMIFVCQFLVGCAIFLAFGSPIFQPCQY
jgi:hypothetical protein